MSGTTTGRDLDSEVAFLTRALKAPTLREAVGRLAERARPHRIGSFANRAPVRSQELTMRVSELVSDLQALRANLADELHAVTPSAATARELGIHLLAAGHHASEQFGVQALAAHLADRFELEWHFVEVANPV